MPWISLPETRAAAHGGSVANGVEADGCQPVMAAGHQAGGHAALALSDPAVTQEVVAVHQGQLAQEELDGALAPPLLWTLALREQSSRLGRPKRGRRDGTRLLQPAPAGV